MMKRRSAMALWLCTPIVIGACSSTPSTDGPAGGGGNAGGPSVAGSATNAGNGGTKPNDSLAGSGGQSAGAPNGGGGGTTSQAGAQSQGGSQVQGGSAGSGGVGQGGSEVTGPWPPSATFDNPILWQDLADPEVIRVGDVYYYTGSNMHYSPGAPILRSYDLINWEYAGHAVPVMDFGANYDLSGGNAYIKGNWASTLQYRKSNQTFYWLGCMSGRTYVYTAKAVEGPWEKHPAINNCYYDAGMLIDDDDKMYVAYGNPNMNVAELSADGFSQVKAQQVYSPPDMVLEGSRFYKRAGQYYIFPTRPADGQFILKSSSPWGPYTRHTVIDKTKAPIAGAGVPHQGGLIETAAGDWYYMGFVDAYPGARMPVLAPVTWGADGWPTVQLEGNTWSKSYPYPNVPRPPRLMKPHTGTVTFDGPTLGHEWEWNHNPDNSKVSFSGGLKLATATVTTDLYKARNTLTHRILGPQSTGTIELDLSSMQDGDVAGLALLRHMSAYVAVRKKSGALEVAMVSGLTMDGSWNTTSTGKDAESKAFTGSKIWLRLSADITPGSGRQGKFSYSTDGTTFTAIGTPYTMNNSWEFFMAYRFGIFNFASTALGGSVTLKSFALTTP
jgi:beta-xylosidase